MWPVNQILQLSMNFDLTHSQSRLRENLIHLPGKPGRGLVELSGVSSNLRIFLTCRTRWQGPSRTVLYTRANSYASDNHCCAIDYCAGHCWIGLCHDLVSLSLFAGQPGIGFFVSDDLFFFGIPFNLAIEPNRDVRQVQRRHRAVVRVDV